MSTDRKKKKKRIVPRFERIKLIEYGCIGLVVAVFLILAIVYGSGKSTKNRSSVDASPSPVPTVDSSIRGKAVFDALDGAGFSVSYQNGEYEVISPDGIAFQMQMESDDKGILELTFETPLCPDPEENSETARLLRAENHRTVNEMRKLFDCVMPVFHRSVYDVETIIKQSQKVTENGEAYAKHFGHYSVRILTDPEAVPQTVTISLIRDP